MLQRIEYVPQRQYYIDDQPANIAGEFPGIKCNHWNGSIRIINQIRNASFSNPNPSLPSLGRRHFDEKRGKETSMLSTKKLIKPIKKEDKLKGTKLVVPIVKEEKVYRTNKISTPGKIEGDYTKFMPYKKKYLDKYSLTTKEFLINDELGRKKRLETVEDRRNGMSVRAPGDKIYKNPEWSQRFFQEGGLVIGSTNTFNYKKTLVKGNNNFYETLDLKVKTLDDKKTWEFKERYEDLKTQKDYVKSLQIWEENALGKIDEKEEENIKNKGKDNKANKNVIKKK